MTIQSAPVAALRKSGMRGFRFWFALAAAALVVFAAGATQAAAASPPIVVDDDGAECTQADHATIQAAVDEAAARPGTDRVQVCLGTYAEDVKIGPDNSLTLEGRGGEPTVTGAPGSSDPIIHADRAGVVDIRRLVVDGQSARSGSFAFGIRYDDTAGRVSHSTVRNIRDASGSTQGLGVGIRSGSSDVRVDHLIVENVTRANIFLDGEGTDARVDHNTLEGPEAPIVWAPNGIQISFGAGGTADHNQITGFDHPCNCASGIIFFEAASDTTAAENDVADGDIGIVAWASNEAVVRQNRIDDNDSDNIRFRNMEGGEIFANQVSAAGDDGVQVSNGSTGVLIETNRADNSADDGYVATSSTSGNTFLRNRATGSGKFSCNDTGTSNTWEKNRGESPSNPPGIC